MCSPESDVRRVLVLGSGRVDMNGGEVKEVSSRAERPLGDGDGESLRSILRVQLGISDLVVVNKCCACFNIVYFRELPKRLGQPYPPLAAFLNYFVPTIH